MAQYYSDGYNTSAEHLPLTRTDYSTPLRHPGVLQNCNRDYLKYVSIVPVCPSLSEPPESHVDDKRDEDYCHGSHFGIGGARVEVFGVAAVLL